MLGEHRVGELGCGVVPAARGPGSRPRRCACSPSGRSDTRSRSPPGVRRPGERPGPAARGERRLSPRGFATRVLGDRRRSARRRSCSRGFRVTSHSYRGRSTHPCDSRSTSPPAISFTLRLNQARRLNEQLQAALDSRVVIEQAKGLLAGSAASPSTKRSPSCPATPAAATPPSTPSPGPSSKPRAQTLNLPEIVSILLRRRGVGPATTGQTPIEIENRVDARPGLAYRTDRGPGPGSSCGGP